MQLEPAIPTLAHVWAALTGQAAPSRLADSPVANFVIDSRQVSQGSCFVALRGERLDGHDFITDSLQRGAMAVIAEEQARKAVEGLESSLAIVPCPAPCTEDSAGSPLLPHLFIVEDSLRALQDVAAYWRSQFNPRVVGVTGSVGKSTSKEMIAAVLGQRHPTLKNPGNLNNEIGLPLTVLRLRGVHRHAVLEMGMYDLGEIATLAAIARPQLGVVTNIGPTHLERLGSLERIAEAKAELVQSLPEDGFAVLNRDDPLVFAMADLTRAQPFYYGLTPDCDLWASDIASMGLEGIRCQFHHGDERPYVKIPLLGRHSVHTALRAAAVGLIEGLSWEEIVSGLLDVSAQLRLIAVPGIRGSTLLDDSYNASPGSTQAALNLLEDLDGRRVAVLGDMMELGSFEEAGHRQVGCRAADVVQLLITVGERARWIGEEALECGMASQAVHMLEDKDSAVRLLHSLVESGDTILVKGSRSMGMEEIVASLSRPPSGLGKEN